MLGNEILGVCNMIERGQIDAAMQVDNVKVEYQNHGTFRTGDEYKVTAKGHNDEFIVSNKTHTMFKRYLVWSMLYYYF